MSYDSWKARNLDDENCDDEPDEDFGEYRGYEIRHTADVMGFPVLARFAFCFVSGYRRDDDAPMLSMHATIAECEAEIDNSTDAENVLAKIDALIEAAS